MTYCEKRDLRCSQPVHQAAGLSEKTSKKGGRHFEVVLKVAHVNERRLGREIPLEFCDENFKRRERMTCLQLTERSPR
jgi:hypothetical protein